LIALVLPSATVPKFKVLDERVTGAMPVPVRVVVCGLLLALSTMVNVPVSGATVVGANDKTMVQFAPPANVLGLAGQVPPVRVKLPLTAISLMVRGTAWTFVSVSVLAALVVPSA
jgi:hypothetical protein